MGELLKDIYDLPFFDGLIRGLKTDDDKNPLPGGAFHFGGRKRKNIGEPIHASGTRPSSILIGESVLPAWALPGTGGLSFAFHQPLLRPIPAPPHISSYEQAAIPLFQSFFPGPVPFARQHLLPHLG